MTDHDRPSRASSLTAWLAAMALGLGGFALAGCGADNVPTAEAPAAEAAADGVEVEAAYPEEVSGEGPTAEDARQQEMPHAHDDGEAHAHDDEGEDDHHHDDDDGGHTH